MSNIRWGIIGTGRIAVTFAEALAGCEEAELYAVASRSEERAAAFAEKHGFSKAYGSYEQLAADPEVDIVYIATPMSSHYDDTLLCLRRGKHVLCEKAAAINSRELDDMITLAGEKNLFFMEAMWMKCRPVYLKAKEWVKRGSIGDIKCVKADFCNLVKYDPKDRLFAPECGGGALLDLAVYPLTLAVDFLGNYPCEIISSANIGRDGVDLSNSIMLRYQGGKYASINSGFQQPCRNGAAIIGTEGSVIFGEWFFCTCEAVLYDRDGSELERAAIPNEINGYEYEIYEAHRCIRAGLRESTLIPHSGTKAVMSIMDECRSQWDMYYPSER